MLRYNASVTVLRNIVTKQCYTPSTVIAYTYNDALALKGGIPLDQDEQLISKKRNKLKEIFIPFTCFLTYKQFCNPNFKNLNFFCCECLSGFLLLYFFVGTCELYCLEGEEEECPTIE